MAEESSDEVKRIEDLTEDDIYGHPERDPRWIEALERVDRKKAANNVRDDLAKKRREFLDEKFGGKGNPSELEQKAYKISNSKIPREELLEFLDSTELDLALKEALVQKYCDVNNYFTYVPSKKEINENFLIKQLKENRPKELLNLPQKVPVKQSRVAAKK